MNLRVFGFEWDDGNREHCQQHGVSQTEIEEILRAGPRVAPDLKHAAIEERFFAVGRTAAGRATYVVFTLRGELIRPLSARYMHAGEIAKYET